MNKLRDYERQLSGLEKLCKFYGRMQCGDLLVVWDYARNIAVPESQMRLGTKRWKASEKAKYTNR